MNYYLKIESDLPLLVWHYPKNIWKHPEKSLLEYRRKIRTAGKEENEDGLSSVASELWKLKWSLLKKPSNLGGKESEAIEAIEIYWIFRDIYRKAAHRNRLSKGRQQ